MGYRLHLRVFWLLVFLPIQAISKPPLKSPEATNGELFQLYEQLENSWPETTTRFSARQRQQLFDEVRFHPIARLGNLPKYDPKDVIGFCFGRAMAAHLLARRRGLARDSIRKLFVIGDLRTGPKPEWYFHVVTAVLGEDYRWYAIDPIMVFPIASGKPQLAKEWIAKVHQIWDKNKKAHFYFTGPTSVMPDVQFDPLGNTGEHIIETEFNPDSKIGFSSDFIGLQPVYFMLAYLQQRHFMATDENEPFNFVGLALGEHYYFYNGYFEDLLKSMTKALKSRTESPLAKAPSIQISYPNDRFNLHSLRLPQTLDAQETHP